MDAGLYECSADNMYSVDRRSFKTDFSIAFDWLLSALPKKPQEFVSPHHTTCTITFTVTWCTPAAQKQAAPKNLTIQQQTQKIQQHSVLAIFSIQTAAKANLKHKNCIIQVSYNFYTKVICLRYIQSWKFFKFLYCKSYTRVRKQWICSGIQCQTNSTKSVTVRVLLLLHFSIMCITIIRQTRLHTEQCWIQITYM